MAGRLRGRRRRVLSGSAIAVLLTLLIGVSSVSAQVPFAEAEVQSIEVREYQRDFGVSAQRAERTLEVQAKAASADLADGLEARLDENFAGVWFDNEAEEYVVPLPSGTVGATVGREMTDAKLAEDYRTRVVQYSWEELEAAQDQINLRLHEFLEAGLVYTSLDPRANAAVVHIAADVENEERAALTRIAKDVGDEVELRAGPEARFGIDSQACSPILSVANCGTPFRGGVTIGLWQDTKPQCTAGFPAMGANGKRYVITAAHCVIRDLENPDLNNPLLHWQAWDEQALPHVGKAKYLGEVEQISSFPTYDWTKIDATGTEWDTWNTPQGWSSMVAYWGEEHTPPAISEEYPITEEASSIKGQTVCHSGIATGGTCGQVVETDVSMKREGGMGHDLVEVKNACNWLGDSGGPWFFANTAYGIHNAGDNGGGAPCEGHAYYQEITQATNDLNVSIGGAGGSSESSPPILEEDDNSPGPRAIAQSNGTVNIFFRTTSGNLGHHWYVPGNGWSTEIRPASIAPSSVPHVVTRFGTVNIFYRDTSGNLGHHWYVPGSGWAVETRSASMASDPHVVAQANGTVNIFYRDTSGNLGHHWYVPGSGWAVETRSASMASDPHVVAQANATVDIFYRDTSGNLGHHWYVPGSGWKVEARPASMASDPRPVAHVNGTVDIFYRDTNGNLGHQWWTQASGWAVETRSASIAPSSLPRVITQANGTVDIFYRDTNGNLGHQWWTKASGWAVETRSAAMASDPHLVARENGKVNIFFRTTSGNLGHHWYVPGNGWAEEIRSASMASDPRPVILPDGKVDIFFRTTSGALGHHWYVPGNGWGVETRPGPIVARPPIVTSGAAMNITESNATLTANVNPDGSPTSYYFEYGATTSYGSKKPASAESVGYGYGDVMVNQVLSGLTEGATYHYRVVATSPEGTSYGADKTFVPSAPAVAFQANGGELWTYSTASGGKGTGWTVRAGTSPSIAVMPDGSKRVAFQATNGELWVYSSATGQKTATGLIMMAATSPAITALSDGSHQIAFQASTGYLGTYSSTSGGKTTNLGMKSGTSPAISAYLGTSYQVAFHDNTGYLWTYSPLSGAATTNLGMKSGTSPAISTFPAGGYQVVFHDNTGYLWTYSLTSGGKTTNLGMKAGTSPSIDVMTDSTYQVAFHDNTGYLWTYAPPSGGKWIGLGMMAGASPAITALSGGSHHVAFPANTGELWTYMPPTNWKGTGLGMAAGTSPSID